MIVRPGMEHCEAMAQDPDYAGNIEKRITGKRPVMKKLQGLSAEQLREISRQIADAFYDYTYNEADIGDGILERRVLGRQFAELVDDFSLMRRPGAFTRLFSYFKFFHCCVDWFFGWHEDDCRRKESARRLPEHEEVH